MTGTLSRDHHGRAQVFCVSNTLYSTYRDDDGEQASAYVALSGIPDLRRYCQSVPADAQMRATESYLGNQVPALLGSITQWTLARSDSAIAGRAEMLRRVLTDAEKTVQMV